MIDEIDGKVLAPKLFQEKAISSDDLERLTTLPLMTRRDRAVALMKMILSSETVHTFQSFMSALDGNGYDHVVEKLLATDVQGEMI